MLAEHDQDICSLKAPFGLVRHQRLALQSGRVALLARNTSGWCVLERDDYARLSEFLATLSAVPSNPAQRETLRSLWDAGLLTSANNPKAAFIRKSSPFPTSLLLKLTGACNISCEYCYDYDRHRFKARLDFDQARRTSIKLLSKVDRLDRPPPSGPIGLLVH